MGGFVLVGCLFWDPAIIFPKVFFFGPPKGPPAGLFGDTLQDLLAIRTRLFWMSSASAPAHTAVAPVFLPATMRLFVFEENGIHHGVRALCRLDRTLQQDLAAMVHTIGQNDYRFASLLLAH